MKTSIDFQRSSELQELYLENKQWLSDLIFLEGEMRFFQNLFDKVLSAKDDKKYIDQIAVIGSSLNNLHLRRKHLKTILDCRREKLEALLEGKTDAIGIELIEEDAAIVSEIKLLMASDQLVKAELFVLMEELKAKQKRIGLPSNFKINRYPIF